MLMRPEKIPLAPGKHTLERLGSDRCFLYSLVRVLTPSRGVRTAICEYVLKHSDPALLDRIALEIEEGKTGKTSIRGIETPLVPAALKDFVYPANLQFFNDNEKLLEHLMHSEKMYYSSFFIEGNPEQRFPELMKDEKFRERLTGSRSW